MLSDADIIANLNAYEYGNESSQSIAPIFAHLGSQVVRIC